MSHPKPWAMIVIVALLALPVLTSSQSAPPATDIYLMNLTTVNGRIQPGSPQNITDRDGYDNQPAFSSDGRSLLFNSNRSGQNDIYRYDIVGEKITRLTETSEGEYSPTYMPSGRGISAVRVEGDGTQRLWRFDLEGKNPALLLPEVQPVGYHVWGDENRLALFILGTPPTLHLADVSSGKSQAIEKQIGRSLQKMPQEHMISFVHKASAEEWWIQSLHIDSKRLTRIIRTMEGSEDHVWTPDGTLLMGRGSGLYQADPRKGSEWLLVRDLAHEGIEGISRLAVSPGGDRLALVANHSRRR